MTDYKTPAQAKTALSLNEVDNTSDADKPVSSAGQTALNLKANASAVSSVDNTSDADKPVSSAGQTALDLKADASGLVDSTLQSKFDGNDFRDGAAGWTVSGGDAFAFGSGGLTIDKETTAGSFPALRVFKTVNGGVPLTVGNKYALYSDFYVSGDTVSSGVSTVLWRPFTLNGAGTTADSKRVTVGPTATPVRHQVVSTFVATATGGGNPYVDVSSPKTASDQNMNAVVIKVLHVAFMVVDLGGPSDLFNDFTDIELASMISSLGAPFHPSPSAQVNFSAKSVKSLSSEQSEASSTSVRSETAASADAVLSPFVGKRLMTLGHSLVSQAGWQGYLNALLDLEACSIQGISGGALQPSNGFPGMFSRAYFNDMLNTLVNPNDQGASTPGISTRGFNDHIRDNSVASILWLGANDSVTDLGNTAFKTCYLDGSFISTLAAKAAGLSEGDFADTTAGVAATSEGEYFTIDGDVTGFKVLYKNRGSLGIQIVYHYPLAGTAYKTDRIMTTSEQNEFETRNSNDGASLFVSEPLSNNFIVTYEALYHTMIFNYLTITGYDDVPEHQVFIVREPQAFWAYDGTLDWPQGHYEKNEVHKRVSDRWGMPLIDLWANSGYNILSRGQFLQNEASGALLIHQTSKGGKRVAVYIDRFLRQFPTVDYTGLYGINLATPTSEGDLGPWNVDNLISE